MISAENIVPYDRTLLTKVLATGDANKFKLRDENFLKEADIDVKLGVKAQSVDTTNKEITLSDGTTVVSCKIIFIITVL